eukprot:scaffold234740_cov28-Tisochrysis_lutea.AAC.1
MPSHPSKLEVDGTPRVIQFGFQPRRRGMLSATTSPSAMEKEASSAWLPALSSSSGGLSGAISIQPIAKIGSKDERLQTMSRLARFAKLVSLTPKAAVRSAPISDPTAPATLKSDMSVAKSTPSTPGGQRRAASTRSGIKAS